MIHLESAVLLNLIPEIGPVRFRNLRNHFVELHEVFAASVQELMRVDGISELLARKILSYSDKRTLAVQELQTAESRKIAILTQEDPRYPDLLKILTDPPSLLYCKGNLKLLKEPSVALVGTRKPTPYGERTAFILTQALVGKEVITVSGLARGIDTVVHKTTLQSGGQTIAVLGSGLLKIYPPENKKLAEMIGENSLLVSEFPLEAPPEAGHFPRRNRVIAGLSLGTVVIEADDKSGALITARLAAEQGKEIFAVPGPISSKMSRGPHRLLRDGAKLVEKYEDILEELQPLKNRIASAPELSFPKNAGGTNHADLNDRERFLSNLIHFDPVHIDVLYSRCGLTTGEFAKVLLSLEMKGNIRALPGKMYVRN